MYKIFFKPILFWLSAEKAYHLTIWILKLFGRLPFGLSILRSLYRVDDPSLEREVFGVKFSNPVGMAAGFDVNGELTTQLGAMGFGFVEVGGITPEPQSGHPKPRLFRLTKDRGVITRMGHPNRGWVYAIERLRKRDKSVVVGCNIARNNNTPHSGAGREFLKSFRNLYQYVDYFTVNINYKHLYCDEEVTTQMAITALLTPLFEFRRGQSDYRPILIKVAPDVDDETLDAIGDVLISTPLDGVVAVNGTTEREGLKTSDTTIAKIGKGRLTGAPLRKRALEVVHSIHNHTGGAYPIIGVGGISTAEEADEMIKAGASLVQIYSGLIFNGPSTAGDICRGLITKPTPEEEIEEVEVTE